MNECPKKIDGLNYKAIGRYNAELIRHNSCIHNSITICLSCLTGFLKGAVIQDGICLIWSGSIDTLGPQATQTYFILLIFRHQPRPANFCLSENKKNLQFFRRCLLCAFTFLVVTTLVTTVFLIFCYSYLTL